MTDAPTGNGTGSRAKGLLALVAVLALVVVGCGDDGGGSSDDADGGTTDAGADSGDGGSSGAVVDAAAPGSARASVDGLDFELTLVGGLQCSIDDEAITFSFRIGDNEVVVGGGLNHDDEGWFGLIELTVAEPDGEPGPISYYPTPSAAGPLDGSLVAVDGSSMSYSGPMLKQPPNDGSNPDPVDVGNGTISATCG